MAVTRKFLTALGIEEDKVDEIITRHVEVVDALKEERDKYKEDAEALVGVRKELDELKANSDEKKENSYKVKYEAIKEEFEAYKKEIEDKDVKDKKESAYRQLLKDCGIPEKRIDAILRVSDIESIEFDDDGKIKDKEKLTESIKEEWSDFIPTTKTEGAKVANPPSGVGKVSKTKEEIRAISDPVERQKAMMDNPELFGLPKND
jgi:hypothetical protein